MLFTLEKNKDFQVFSGIRLNNKSVVHDDLNIYQNKYEIKKII